MARCVQPARAGRDATGAAAATEERAVVPECAEARAALLKRVEALALPPNFLDHMIDQLGGPKVEACLWCSRGNALQSGTALRQ